MVEAKRDQLGLLTLSKRRPPIEVARDLLTAKFPGAVLAFVAGSFNRGEETAFSDIDFVLLFEKVERAWRESFTFEGWPVEVFAHDPQTLRYFIFEGPDTKAGLPTMQAMVLEGIAIPSEHLLANEIKRMAQKALDAGPPVWDGDALAGKRYAIGDLLDDLRDPRSAIEAAAIIGALHQQLGDFYFRAQGLWSASTKHLPRRLAKINPVLFVRWEEAFLEAWRGRTTELIDLAEDILRPYGGILFDGYRLNAPDHWKLEDDEAAGANPRPVLS